MLIFEVEAALCCVVILRKTKYLSVSVGGNCNTVLVANIYGEAARIEETVRSGIYYIQKKTLFLAVCGVISALDDN